MHLLHCQVLLLCDTGLSLQARLFLEWDVGPPSSKAAFPTGNVFSMLLVLELRCWGEVLFMPIHCLFDVSSQILQVHYDLELSTSDEMFDHNCIGKEDHMMSRALAFDLTWICPCFLCLHASSYVKEKVARHLVCRKC